MKIAFVLLSVVRAPIAKRAAPLCGSDNFSTENVSFYFYAPDKILSELPQKRGGREGMEASSFVTKGAFAIVTEIMDLFLLFLVLKIYFNNRSIFPPVVKRIEF